MDEIKCEHEEVCGCCDVDHEECEYFAPKVDRDALNGLVEYLNAYAEWCASAEGYPYVNAGELWSYADKIREALGEGM